MGSHHLTKNLRCLSKSSQRFIYFKIFILVLKTMNPEQFLLCVFLLAISTHLAESLSCVQCNSVYSPSCLSSEDSMKHLYPCPSKRHCTLCRKIDQTVRGNRIVLRKCGWVGTGSHCYRTVSDEFNTKTCHCEEPGCNKGGRVHSGIGLWMMSLCSLFIFVS